VFFEKIKYIYLYNMKIYNNKKQKTHIPPYPYGQMPVYPNLPFYAV
jgi:hypothetical protein